MDLVCIGCYTEPSPATEEIQKICNKVKPQVEKETGKNYGVFTALMYQSQIVQGVNYTIMVYVGENDCLYVKVYQDLSEKTKMTGVEKGPNPPEPVILPPEALSQQALPLK
ncbi:leukocyte cysteine proteinase inhibitor 1-like [Halichoeres trimaculatus]|uniref:leukocyte cysteine proteinase inhibitor 1-like n=1 Tax=Halichoeres trimaculatus TaxID=147232 RepID=UPI003D9F6CFE